MKISTTPVGVPVSETASSEKQLKPISQFAGKKQSINTIQLPSYLKCKNGSTGSYNNPASLSNRTLSHQGGTFTVAFGSTVMNHKNKLTPTNSNIRLDETHRRPQNPQATGEKKHYAFGRRSDGNGFTSTSTSAYKPKARKLKARTTKIPPSPVKTAFGSTPKPQDIVYVNQNATLAEISSKVASNPRSIGVKRKHEHNLEDLEHSFKKLRLANKNG
ncbi:hypothetical protein [Endozoicomonas sp. Mp262]|uniref:hypothetical protein n=1 Tax=Endozoicomonas sp. Mp262 TaxID=2919499 RepID=UPI0021DB491E